MFARAMQSDSHPILARSCLSAAAIWTAPIATNTTKVSDPVPLTAMLARIDRLGDLGATIITLSGGEPTLHPGPGRNYPPHSRARRHRDADHQRPAADPGADSALESAPVSIICKSASITSRPDEVSKKSLQVLDRKLEWLAREAEFGVTINSVLGAGDSQSAGRAGCVGRGRASWGSPARSAFCTISPDN